MKFANNSAHAGGAINIDDEAELGKLIFAGRTMYSDNIASGAINIIIGVNNLWNCDNNLLTIQQTLVVL